MSVEQAQSDFGFAAEFHNHVEALINIVSEWEHHAVESNVPKEAREGLSDYQSRYLKQRVAITLGLVRFRELCKRYGIQPSEEWINSYIPLVNLDVAPPSGPYIFTPGRISTIYKETISLRGATLRHLELEKAKAARPWNQKAGDYAKVIWKWLDDRGLAKLFVLVLIGFLVAAMLKWLGYDRAGIIEIIKAVPKL